jgi:bacterioferritin
LSLLLAAGFRKPKSSAFLSDVHELRRRARAHILQGAVTSTYAADRETSIRLLNEALATELVCVLRYKSHAFEAEGLHAHSVVAEFEEHAREEQEHADAIARRICQLEGKPEFDPQGLLSKSHSEFRGGETLIELIEEDLVAERIAIDSYREMIQFFGDADSTSRRLMERILEKEEEHAEELSGLLKTIDPSQRSRAA